MATFDDDIDAKVAQLIAQWNIAERRIKKAEQVCGGRIVASAIFELRYAARKLIDAIELLTIKDWRNTKDERDKILEYLDDAIEDCVKAKHDAIDAMMDFVTVWFEKARRSLGATHIQQFFPDFLGTRVLIKRIQDKIEESRGDRTKLRDSIYDEIEKSGYDQVLDLYDRMRLSKDIMESEVRRERWGKIILWIVTIFFGVSSVILGIPSIPEIIKWFKGGG